MLPASVASVYGSISPDSEKSLHVTISHPVGVADDGARPPIPERETIASFPVDEVFRAVLLRKNRLLDVDPLYSCALGFSFQQ